MTGEVLFLCHRIPFPPDRGDKIRSHHILRKIAEYAPVHVATMAESDGDFAAESALADCAASYCLARRSKPLPLAGIEALTTGKPVSLTAFHHRDVAAYVARVLAERPISAIFGYSGQMGQYLPQQFTGPVVFDFVDADSAKFESYAADAGWPKRALYSREARLLKREEARIASLAGISVLASPDEADVFKSRLPFGQRETTRVVGIRNGVDWCKFDPAKVDAAPQLAQFGGPRLIFTGQMDYPPNIEAAWRLAQRILPDLRSVVPDATVHIVGRNPPSALRALHGCDGFHVWGEVPDVRPWLAGGSIAVIPLNIARGVQNKVIEAMAMALPVIATTGAATGVGARPGADIVIADGDADIVARCAELANDHDRAIALGLAGQRHVRHNLEWQTTLAPLPAMLGLQ